MRIGALSGSLQKLLDGNDYLVAGTNITLTTGSAGEVTIDATGGGGGGGGSPAAPFDSVQYNDAGSFGGSAKFRFIESDDFLILTASFSQGENVNAAGANSHAEGEDNTAYAAYSHAEGKDNEAYGLGSHVEGFQSISFGFYTHAEGTNTFAYGMASHAEGVSTVTSASYSHAEGVYTIANGVSSHAEGYASEASGSFSHAEGLFTLTSGSASHTEGSTTVTYGHASHAEGSGSIAGVMGYSMRYVSPGNYSYAGQDLTSIFPTNTFVIIESVDRLSHSVNQVVNITWLGANTSITVDPASTQDPAIMGSAIGPGGSPIPKPLNADQTMAWYSHSEGEGTYANGLHSHAEGKRTKAPGESAHAEGNETIARGPYSHAEGGLGSVAAGLASHAEGGGTTASGDYSHAEGGSGTTASGNYSHAEGFSTTASGLYSHAEGGNTTALGLASHAEGGSTIASGSYQHASGKFNLRGNDFSLFVIGNGTGDADVARSDVLRVNSGSIGDGRVEVTGSLAATMGLSGSLTQLVDGTSYLIAGTNITITSASNGAVTIAAPGGGGGGASYFDSTTNGSIYTTGSAAFVGAEAVDSPADKGDDVFFYVSGSQSSKDGATPGVALFGGDVVISGTLHGGSPLKVGSGVQITGSFIQGQGDVGFMGNLGGASPAAIGSDVFFFVSGSAGDDVAAFGGDLVVSGTVSIGGDSLEVTGTISATQGFSGSLTTLADGTSYLIAGTNITITSASNGAITIDAAGGPSYFDSTTSGSIFTSGSAAFVGGGDEWNVIDSPADKGTDVFFYVSGSQSSKDGAVPGVALFGGDVVISGTLHGGSPLKIGSDLQITGSFSQGLENVASGLYSHAEGYETLAVGNYSHAEGESTIASGNYSHAEGGNTTASGPYSHAEGTSTTALGNHSHAEGQGTIASGSHQHVGGKYNLRNNDFSLFVIGNGTGDDDIDRSDIVRVNPDSVQLTGSLIQSNSGSSTVGFMGNLASSSPTTIGSDIFFFVSGSVGADVASFGGDLVVSGTVLIGGDALEMTGTISATQGFSGSLTTLTDGTSYLIAGSNITIASASNGAVTISSSAATSYYLNLFAGTISSTAASASMESIGMDYYDVAKVPAGATSYTFQAILATTLGTTAYMDLYDYNGIVTGIPGPISGSVLTGSNQSYTYLTADLTPTLSAVTGSGIFEARIWCDPTGVSLNAICKNAKLEIY